jgi:hypothetical protein
VIHPCSFILKEVDAALLTLLVINAFLEFSFVIVEMHLAYKFVGVMLGACYQAEVFNIDFHGLLEFSLAVIVKT